MPAGSAFRLIVALALIAGSALAVFLLDQDPQPAIVALVGGVAAVLVAAGVGTDREEEDEPALRPAEDARLAGEIADAVVAPVLLVSAGQITLANAAARQLLGSHIVGQDVRLAIRHPAAAERLSAADGDVSAAPIDLVGLGARDQRWEMRIGTTSDGQRIVNLLDQTGRYAAERMRVDFVANASHELRTPLASVLGYVETLRDEAGEVPALRERFLRIIDDEARRMQRLVEDLMSLSRIEADKYRLPDNAVDLAALAHEVKTELGDALDARADDVQLDLADGLPPVIGDRAQLSQLLHNLIGNALKYGRPDTPVAVRLTRDTPTMLRLTVTDHGEGIPPEHIPRLTERFYRVDAGRSRALGGTGLGLAIVKHIVERHRGRIEIASRVGEGTTVTVLLPVAGAVTRA